MTVRDHGTTQNSDACNNTVGVREGISHMFNQKRQEPTGVFNGPQLLVICRDVSDVDCDRAMKADSDHCGDPTHLRARPRPIGPARVISDGPAKRGGNTTRQAPGSIYETEVEWVAGAVEFDPDLFDSDTVRVIPNVQRAFSAFHRCSAHEAVEGVRLVMSEATKENRVRLLSSKSYQFTWRGFFIIVSRDLAHAYRYQTAHQEQTPQMVLNKVPSRFSGAEKRVRREERSENARRMIDDGSVSVGDVVEGLVGSVTNFGVFLDIGVCDFLVHRSEIPDADSEDLHQRFHIGEQMRAKIIEIDKDRSRIKGSLMGLDDHQGEPRPESAGARKTSFLDRIGLGRATRSTSNRPA